MPSSASRFRCSLGPWAYVHSANRPFSLAGDATILVKVHTRGAETLVAACDERLLGRTLREGEIRLHVSSFYEGERMTPEEFAKALLSATIGNFVGRETVEAAQRAGFVGEAGVMWIEGEPHAQMFVMPSGS